MRKNNIGSLIIFGIINLTLVAMTSVVTAGVINFLCGDNKNPDSNNEDCIYIEETVSINASDTVADNLEVSIDKSDVIAVGVPQSTNSLEFEEDNPWDGNMTSPVTETIPQESITVPGYTCLRLSESNTTATLTNPAENTVYFQYSIFENDVLIYSSENIAPGGSAEADLRNFMPVGEHKVTIVISTFDITTLEPCNGASQSGVTVIIN